MFENKQKKMISRILAHHGFKNQLIKTVEELSELTTAILCSTTTKDRERAD